MAVTIADVKKVYKGEISDADLTNALETAQLVVSEQLAGSPCNMSTARLDKITIYLTAHFAELTSQSSGGVDGPLRRSKLGEADESYAVPLTYGDGYRSTRWGQMAVALDTCGKLLSQGTLKAQFEVV